MEHGLGEIQATLHLSVDKLVNEASRRCWVEPFLCEAKNGTDLVWSMIVVAGDDRQEYFDRETLEKFADVPKIRLRLTDAKGAGIHMDVKLFQGF
jgi:hypothetical protein